MSPFEGSGHMGKKWTNPRAWQRASRDRPIDGSSQEQLLVGRVDNSGARGFGCWLWISRPHATSSYTVGCG